MSARNSLIGVALTLAGGLGLAHAQHAAKAPAWTEPLTRQALATGYEATLPPHVSMVLGLAPKSESVPVKQLVGREGQKVHTYNVSVAHQTDIALFLADESVQSTVAYLLSSRGKLRKAVSYQAGGDPRELTPSEAHGGLAREIRYWTDYSSGRHAVTVPPASGPRPAIVPKPAGAPRPAEAPKPADLPKPADSPKPPGGATNP